MSAALRICRDYGQPPSWWSGLSRSDQALLLAEQRERDAAERRAVDEMSRAAQSARRGPARRVR